MKPDTRTITQLFELDVRYVVPLYQRPYVWQRDEQWQPLWDDIATLLDHRIADASQDYSHFLGAVVFDQVTQPPGRIPVYTVIDGQQRLTTLQIVLAAAANVCARLGGDDEAAILRDLIRNNERKADGIELFKVWPTNANRAAFRDVMLNDGLAADRGARPESRIDEAYEFFAGCIAEWADEGGPEQRAIRLELLRVTICDLLKVVTITLEPGDNAQVIFETLNARGTPLLALDLVKNAIFMEAARRELSTDPLYDEVWRPELDDEYWRRSRRQGRLNRPAGELFLMHWLTMKLRRVVPATELFLTFRTHLLAVTSALQMDALIHELCRDAAILRSFDSPEPGGPEETFFHRLRALDTSTVLPLVLFLFRTPEVTAERRRRALRMIESWLVRRMLMGLTAKNYNQQIPLAIERVAADPAGADEILLEELRTGVGRISRWPGDDELREQLRSRGMYGYISQPRLAMVFAAIEESLYTSKVESLRVPRGLSIEHVMPQRWERNWPLPEGLPAEERHEAEAARRHHLHLIGNLTLTTLPLNAALSNASWPEKQRALNSGSKLLLNARLVEEHGERFDEASIQRRTESLTDRIIAVWPGPDSWVNPPASIASEAPSVSVVSHRTSPAQAPPRPPSVAPRSDPPAEPPLEADLVLRELRAGLTPDQIISRHSGGREMFLRAIEEEARLDGELGTFQATPEGVALLRDERGLRWERIAARVFGNAKRVQAVRALYDTARGEDASRRSYSGRGRVFPAMHPMIEPTDRVVLLRISRLFRPGMSDDELYEATRGWWVMDPLRHNPDWAFAVADGAVRAVYRIDGWERGDDGRRWGFVGRRDTKMEHRYAEVDVSHLFRRGNTNPVMYVNC